MLSKKLIYLICFLAFISAPNIVIRSFILITISHKSTKLDKNLPPRILAYKININDIDIPTSLVLFDIDIPPLNFRYSLAVLYVFLKSSALKSINLELKYKQILKFELKRSESAIEAKLVQTATTGMTLICSNM